MRFLCRIGWHRWWGMDEMGERVAFDSPFVTVYEIGNVMVCAWCGRRGVNVGSRKFRKTRRVFKTSDGASQTTR